MPGELTAKPRELVKLYFAFRCSFAGCSKGFPDALELRHHKINDPDHFFCPDDNYEATDYADMKRHHATSDQHNACPSSRCGLNTITTVEALRLHIMTKHKSTQYTHCSGCDTHYKSVEALWGHLDMNQAPVVCRGPMNPNVALAKYRDDYMKYVWRDYMKSTGWHHHDQRRWYSDPPDWFLKRLDANNRYVAPNLDPPPVPEDAWDVKPSQGWQGDWPSAGSNPTDNWSHQNTSDWTSPPSDEPHQWPTLGSARTEQSKSKDAAHHNPQKTNLNRRNQRGASKQSSSSSNANWVPQSHNKREPVQNLKSSWSAVAAAT